jgi:hypothetical protein
MTILKNPRVIKFIGNNKTFKTGLSNISKIAKTKATLTIVRGIF